MKAACKLFIALVCALLIWEILLECTMFRSSGATSHPVLGRIPDYGLCLNGREGFSAFSRNRFGFRNPEIGPKQQDQSRILVLGDSYTEAIQVNNQDTFCSQLEQSLHRKGVGNEVINAGRSGASPAYYIHLADYYTRTFEADFVVIQLNEKDFIEDMADRSKPFFIEQDGNDYKTIYRETSNSFTQKHPELSSWITRWSIVQLGLQKKESLFAAKEIKQEAKIKKLPALDQIVAWSVRSFKERYKNVVIVFIPAINYSQPDGQSTEVEDLLCKYSQIYDVTLINMRPVFMNAYSETLQPLHGFYNTMPGIGHINKEGHRLTAQQLSDYFEHNIRMTTP
ncbi:MAG: hypothetical protein H6Q65_65 [Firmicutes bacterium]|nr:hypothetical protein [Bacillota bacterium]